MKVCIYGSGGVGCYFGARFSQAGLDVTFVARGRNYAALNERGLMLTGISGELHLENINVVESPMDCAPYDVVVVAVKAWQVEEAARALTGTLAKDGVVIPLQNGVEAPQQLAAVLGDDSVLAGLCGIVVYLKEPGHIHHVGVEPFMQIGEHLGPPTARVHKLVAKLGCAAVKITAPEDMAVALWMKFLFIVAMSGVGSVTRAPIGITRENPETRILLEACIRETYEVGCAVGVSLPDDAVDKTMQMIDAAPAEGTASMQRDIANGLPSELYNQNEVVRKLGSANEVATPVNELISAVLLPLEQRARGIVDF